MIGLRVLGDFQEPFLQKRFLNGVRGGALRSLVENPRG